MIIALQCCPLDAHHALELTRLICDIELNKRADVEYCIACRKDTPPELVGAMRAVALEKFTVCHVVAGKRTGVGWPVGPNDLWAETMMRLSILRKEGKTAMPAVLTFEPDCVPLRTDWLDILLATWVGAASRGKLVVGNNHDDTHINGNAIFKVDITKQYPELNGADAAAGWDAYHGELLLKLGEDTDAIMQMYQMRSYTRATLECARKRGFIPALFHGTKGADGLRFVRAMWRDGALAANALTPRPEYNASIHLPSASVCATPETV